MGRVLRAEREVCPTIPTGYFNTEAEELLTAFRRKALTDRSPELFADFPADQAPKDLRNAWHPAARRLYRNWLLYMASQRAGRSKPLALSGRCRTISESGIPARHHGRKLVALRSGQPRAGRDPLADLLTKKRDRIP